MMEKLLFELLANAGPLVVMAGLFLYFLQAKSKASAENWRARDEQMAQLVKSMIEALDRNSAAMRMLDRQLATRPCLWQEHASDLVDSINGLRRQLRDSEDERNRGRAYPYSDTHDPEPVRSHSPHGGDDA